MYHDQSHPLLAQVPLTVSPFVSLPTAITLPYTYKQLPNGLPPSTLGNSDQSNGTRSQYVVSSSGHAAHPKDIIDSCRALQTHLDHLQAESTEQVAQWEESIRARELAEKRRVAPGWLDTQQRILEPVKNQRDDAPATDETKLMTAHDETDDTDEGKELDRMFGAMRT